MVYVIGRLLVSSRLLVVKFWGNQKLYADFWASGLWKPLSSILFKGQLYLHLNLCFGICFWGNPAKIELLICVCALSTYLLRPVLQQICVWPRYRVSTVIGLRTEAVPCSSLHSPLLVQCLAHICCPYFCRVDSLILMFLCKKFSIFMMQVELRWSSCSEEWSDQPDYLGITAHCGFWPSCGPLWQEVCLGS